MEHWIDTHKTALTLWSMLVIAVIGLVSIMTLSGHNGVMVVLILWSIPTILGVVLCVIACIALLLRKTDRKQWTNVLLGGLWFLLVSGGSCGMLWALVYGTALIL